VRIVWMLVLSAGLVQGAWGQDTQPVWPSITELTWMDQNHLEQQRQFVDELARSEFGRPVRGNKSDLELLQRIVDEELMPPNETQNLQALGAVLGDLYAQEHGLMDWRVYEDANGRSRAVCVVDTQNCVFPVTMLSRRIAAGLKPDVQKVYQEGLASLQPYLPRQPFSARQ
jgi:hypothetical protein